MLPRPSRALNLRVQIPVQTPVQTPDQNITIIPIERANSSAPSLNLFPSRPSSSLETTPPIAPVSNNQGLFVSHPKQNLYELKKQQIDLLEKIIEGMTDVKNTLNNLLDNNENNHLAQQSLELYGNNPDNIKAKLEEVELELNDYKKELSKTREELEKRDWN